MSLARFVPDLIKRRIATDPNPITEPIGEPFDAAILFADISGFTPLTERLSRAGIQGAEQLTTYLNRYFGELIQVVRANGGEVLKFAGDALLAQWPAHGDLAAATARAAAASLVIQERLHDYPVEETVRLSMRLALGAGQLHCLHVGGVLGRWEFFITGDPMAQLRQAQALAAAGQVVCSPEAWDLLGGKAQGRVLSGGAVLLSQAHTNGAAGATEIALDDAGQDLLRSFLPGSVLSRYAHGQADWLGELRLVAVLFINLPELVKTRSEDIAAAQRAIEILQRALYRFEGSINKISVDDKGVSVVGAMGLPPMAHEDDADRAVKAAVLIHGELSDEGVSCSIGVSTGTVFCGAVGNDLRAEYTVMGDAVNLAARLMQMADGGILTEEHTWRLSRDTAHFEKLPPLAIKGKEALVQTYRPTGQFVMRTMSSSQMVGRVEEQEVLSERIQMLVRGKQGATIVFEGEAGIGKSRLVAEALNQARAVNAITLLGTGDAIERHRPYHAWRNVFSGLFGLSGAEKAAEVQELVLGRLDDEQQQHAPLLNSVLPLELPDNELTSQVTGVARSDLTDAFLIALLSEAAASSPLVLILEDAHWMDSLSWALLAQVVDGVEPLVVVLSTRPPEQDLVAEYESLVATEGTFHKVLQPLSTDATLALVRSELGVNKLPAAVGELIQAKAEGNPYYSEELAYALRESGAIRIVGDTCEIPGGVASLAALVLPDTVQGVVTSRVDRLAPAQQLALKVASVLGRTFALRMVRDLFPVEADRARLDDVMVELCSHGLLLPFVDGSVETRYTFKHALTQEAIYGLMLFAQRRDMHKLAAEWLEEEHDQDLAPHYARLAHHWLKAEIWPRAVEMLALSGTRAVRHSSNKEAVEQFTQALALDVEHDLGNDALTRGAWEARIHDAWYAAGRLDEARDAGHRALKTLGHAFPTGQAATGMAFMAAAWVRFLQGFFLRFFKARTDAVATAVREAAHINVQLLEVYLFQNDPIGAMVAGFRTVNLAERIEPGAEYARGFSMMAATMDLFMLPKVADRWAVSALSVAEGLGDQPTLSYTLTRIGARTLTKAEFELAEQHLTRSIEISAELGEKRLWEESVATLGKSLQSRGRFAEAEKRWREVTESALSSDNPQIVAWGQLSVAYNLAWQGQAQEALEFMAPEHERVESSEVHLEVIWAHGIHAMASLAHGDRHQALQSADRALAMMSTSQPYPYFMFHAINEVVRVYLRLFEDPEGLTDEDRSGLEAKAKDALKNLTFVGKFFPFARPSVRLQEGTWAWLQGREQAAVKKWSQALALADELGMPLEAGLAHLEWGRHQSSSSPERREHLEQAAEQLERLGATDHAARARTALSP